MTGQQSIHPGAAAPRRPAAAASAGAENGSVPAMIGQYKVLGELARGGMGVVYRAIHPGLRRQVVIKKLTMKANNIVVERFKREAQILLDMKTPYIVHLYDYFVEGNFHYIVLEYVDGMSLDKLIKKQGYLSPQTSMLIFRDACRALQFAHDHGVIHRDIKPANILMSKHGDIKLADFGIASADVDGEESTLTQTGVALGTPSYMPPEQFSASHTVDKRADIYAMGVMLYEMVTGSKPYPGKFTAETLVDIQKGNYTPPEKRNSTIPKIISRLIKRMLKVDPKKRYQSIAPILKKVDKYLADYDIDDIKTQLSLNLSQPVGQNLKPFQEKKFVERGHAAKVVTRVTVWTAIAAVVVLGLFHSGFFYRTVLRHWYTPVTLMMNLPQTHSETSDLMVKAFFYRESDDDDTAQPVQVLEFSTANSVDTVYRLYDLTVGHVLSSLAGQDYYSKLRMFSEDGKPRLHTKPAYLAPGSYRLKVIAGSSVLWKTVIIMHDEQVLPLQHLEDAHYTLQFVTSVTDSVTGEPVKGAQITMQYKGEYVPVGQVPEAALQSGTQLNLRASAPGYESEEYRIETEWYQEFVYLNARIKKQ